VPIGDVDVLPLAAVLVVVLALVLALFVVAVLEVVWELPVVAAVVVGLTVGPSALSVVVLLLCPARIAKTEARIRNRQGDQHGPPTLCR